MIVIDVILLLGGLFFIVTPIKGIMNKSLAAEDVNLGGRLITLSIFVATGLVCFYFSNLVPLLKLVRVLFAIFISGGIVGLIKPELVLRWEAAPDRVQVMKYISVGTLVFVILFLVL